MVEIVVVKGPTKGQRFDIQEKVAFIGRSRTNDIQIKDLTVSRKHLKLTQAGEELVLEDLESFNGTLVDGRKIIAGEGFPTPEGARIQLGKTVISFRKVPGASDAESDYDGEERRSEEARDVELIRDVGWCIANASLGVRGSAERVLQLLLSALPRVDRAALLAYFPENHTLKRIASTFSLKPNGKSPSYSISVVEHVLRKVEPYWIPDTNDEGVPGYPELRSKRIRSVLCVPMFRKSEVWGVLYVDTVRKPNAFRKADVELLENISALLSSYFIKEGFQP